MPNSEPIAPMTSNGAWTEGGGGRASFHARDRRFESGWGYCGNSLQSGPFVVSRATAEDTGPGAGNGHGQR